MSNPPPITLYLGDDLTITGQNVEFNDATVSVKAPVSGLNVVNKAYVDSVNSNVNNLISEETANRIAGQSSLQAMIDSLQSDNTALETQMNNLYQYFFNQPRDGPPPTRE
jgi:hypothetical protein